MAISEEIFAMLLTHSKYKEFTKKEIADANKTSEVILALSVDDKDAVNTIMEKAIVKFRLKELVEKEKIKRPVNFLMP